MPSDMNHAAVRERPAESAVADSQMKLRVAAQSKCILCSAIGSTIYVNLQDRLLHVSGCWNVSKCSNHACELLWLDPMPLKDDLHLAYGDEHYYTHYVPVGSAPDAKPAFRRAYDNVIAGYLALRWGSDPNAAITHKL